MKFQYLLNKGAFTIALLLTAGMAFSQTKGQLKQITSRYDLNNLSQLEKRLDNENKQQKQEAFALAQQRNIQTI